jgi:hypothetical protein
MALVWAAPAAAVTMTYTFTGMLTGFSTTDGGPPVSIDLPIQTSIILTGEAPGTDVGGLFAAVPLSSGLIGSGPPFTALDLPPSAVADFGEGTAGGNAGFGFLLPTPMGLFGVFGAGLSGYNGSGPLASVPVTFVGASELFTHDELHTYGIFVTGFTDATFTAAAVPEPASWALMILGFGAVGAALRSRRRPISA